MPTWLYGVIVFEIAFVLFIVWGYLHESKFVEFEDKIKLLISRKIRKAKRNLCAKWLAEEGLLVPKKPVEIDERKAV